MKEGNRVAERCYLAIDLKSFYASVECVERGLDPLRTNLVVADRSRTEKTICLAVSPALKELGIPGRPRLFEVVRQVAAVNARRLARAPGRAFTGSSCDREELRRDPSLSLDYITATPRMALYMETSARIYSIYLKYAAAEDIHVYSIDEVFIDVTDYLAAAGLSARDYARKIIREVLAATGITATAGIGSNLYLCKIALDIWAKHVPPDEDGVRIAQLDEESYRRRLWQHRPLTDFWRVGPGTAGKLEANGLFTMGDVARCSLGGANEHYNEELLYRLFGVNAELLIDHAWGWEPCTIRDVKAYRPESTSVGAGQVLQSPYDFEKAKIVVREMAYALALDLTERGLEAAQMVLTLGYDVENLTDPARRRAYSGPVTTDRYGRRIPRHAHGSVNLERPTASARLITGAVLELYGRIADPALLLRRITVTAAKVTPKGAALPEAPPEQLDLFTDYAAEEARRQAEEQALRKEEKMQQAMLDIRKKYGKNAITKGTSYQEGATGLDRNRQIGGHKA